jgi:hypothetical protein
VLVADQDGIWSVPHILGALRAGRSEVQRVDQVPPEERKPTAGAYGAKMLTNKGVFGIVQGHQNRPLAVDPNWSPLRWRWLIRQSNPDLAFAPCEFHAAAAPVRILFTILISKGSSTNSPPVCSNRLKWGVAIC